jgi:tetratricopeptide (TPR) repeat protein
VPEISKIALIIGIDTYYHKGLDGKASLAHLESSKNDAIGLYNLLKSKKFSYTIFGNRPLIGSNLNKENGFVKIHRAIKDFFNNADLGQVLLFYFSGHGVPRQGDEVYLATPQVDPKDPFVEGFRLSDLTWLVNTSKARQIVCIIDSCYSGAVNLEKKKLYAAMGPEERDELTAKSARSTSDKILNNILKKEGRYFLLSTQSYAKSYAPKANQNPASKSYFTEYLIEGLKGAKPDVDENGRSISETGSIDENGYVTPESLHSYVSYNVVRKVTEQEPILKCMHTRDRVILVEYPQLAILKASENNILLKLLQEGNIPIFNNERLKPGSWNLLNFYKAKLAEKDLRQANLSETNLSSANLFKANLSGANLAFVDLSKANLSETNLSSANLFKANLSGANLSGTIISEANLTESIILGCKEYSNLKCIKTDFSKAIIDNKELIDYLKNNRAKNIPVNTYQDLMGLLAEAGKWSSKQKYRKAQKTYDKVLSIDPTFSYAYNGRGELRYKLKKYPAALSDFNKAIEYHQNNTRFWKNKKMAHEKLKQPEEAKKAEVMYRKLQMELGYVKKRKHRQQGRKKYEKPIPELIKQDLIKDWSRIFRRNVRSKDGNDAGYVVSTPSIFYPKLEIAGHMGRIYRVPKDHVTSIGPEVVLDLTLDELKRDF